MRACAFAGNLVVLINMDHIQKISIQIRWKPEDFLAPFVFLLVVKGFSGLVS